MKPHNVNTYLHSLCKHCSAKLIGEQQDDGSLVYRFAFVKKNRNCIIVSDDCDEAAIEMSVYKKISEWMDS